ncbi:MAG: hypothetical protein ACIAQF_10220 [Phycisphaerales bacterium JB065]
MAVKRHMLRLIILVSSILAFATIITVSMVAKQDKYGSQISRYMHAEPHQRDQIALQMIGELESATEAADAYIRCVEISSNAAEQFDGESLLEELILVRLLDFPPQERIHQAARIFFHDTITVDAGRAYILMLIMAGDPAIAAQAVSIYGAKSPRASLLLENIEQVASE